MVKLVGLCKLMFVEKLELFDLVMYGGEVMVIGCFGVEVF